MIFGERLKLLKNIPSNVTFEKIKLNCFRVQLLSESCPLERLEIHRSKIA